jgi:hypothetical protein
MLASEIAELTSMNVNIGCPQPEGVVSGSFRISACLFLWETQIDLSQRLNLMSLLTPFSCRKPDAEALSRIFKRNDRRKTSTLNYSAKTSTDSSITFEINQSRGLSMFASYFIATANGIKTVVHQQAF